MGRKVKPVEDGLESGIVGHVASSWVVCVWFRESWFKEGWEAA